MLTQYRMSASWAKTMRKRAGTYIKGLREESKQTQQEVSQKMGWTHYTMVSQIERGLARIPPEDVPLMASVLGVDTAEFAKKLLYFYDPYTYHSIFGGRHPLDQEGMPKERATREGYRGVRNSDGETEE